MRFKFVVAGVNHQKWLPTCLQSIAEQTVKDFDVVVIDDATPDQNFRDWIRDWCTELGWLPILHEENRGAMYSQVHGISELHCEPEDVLVWVDGDDRLAHANVLERLLYHYRDDTKLTYGQYRSEPFSPTCSPARPYPSEVVASNGYRMFGLSGGGLLFNHLRTAKFELFSQLEELDFKDHEGNWFKSAADAAVMIPCMELADGRLKCLEEILYVYNSENPQSDWRIQPKQVNSDHDIILRVRQRKC